MTRTSGQDPSPAPAGAGEEKALRLATELYDASNTSRTRFADRDRPVREAWLREARLRLRDEPPERP